MELNGCASPAHLGPPGGQHEVGVDVVFSKLLGHVEPQGAVRVVDVPLAEVGEDGVGAVQLLELLRRLRVVRVLVGVVPQRQLPDTAQQSDISSATDGLTTQLDGLLSPVGLPDVIMAAALLQSQDPVQRLSGGGQSSLPAVRHPDTITCRRWMPVSQDSGQNIKLNHSLMF